MEGYSVSDGNTLTCISMTGIVHDDIIQPSCFPDIAHGSQSAVMEFLFIRNKLLQTWLQDPTNELTVERAQSIVVLPQSGERGAEGKGGKGRGGRP